jgi:hypothetical protein
VPLPLLTLDLVAYPKILKSLKRSAPETPFTVTASRAAVIATFLINSSSQ